MSDNIVSFDKVSRSFKQGDEELHILKDACLEIKKGETVALVGESGCGKSTLLQLAGLLDRADSGDIIIDNVKCNKISDRKRTKLRCNKIGFIYQFHHLLPDFTALENVMMPQIIAKVKKKKARIYAEDLLSKMGLSERIKHHPSELSGGEQQRVAIARAMANNPLLLLADEPTGNLDPETSDRVFNIMVENAGNAGLAMLIATHDMTLAKKAHRIITIKDGAVVNIYDNTIKDF